MRATNYKTEKVLHFRPPPPPTPLPPTHTPLPTPYLRSNYAMERIKPSYLSYTRANAKQQPTHYWPVKCRGQSNMLCVSAAPLRFISGWLPLQLLQSALLCTRYECLLSPFLRKQALYNYVPLFDQ